jgi:hypothetical protein
MSRKPEKARACASLEPAVSLVAAPRPHSDRRAESGGSAAHGKEPRDRYKIPGACPCAYDGRWQPHYGKHAPNPSCFTLATAARGKRLPCAPHPCHRPRGSDAHLDQFIFNAHRYVSPSSASSFPLMTRQPRSKRRPTRHQSLSVAAPPCVIRTVADAFPHAPVPFAEGSPAPSTAMPSRDRHPTTSEGSSE